MWLSKMNTKATMEILKLSVNFVVEIIREALLVSGGADGGGRLVCCCFVGEAPII